MNRLGRILLVLSLTFLAACSDTPTSPSRPQPQPQPNTSLTITCPPGQTASAPAGGQVAVTFPQPATSGGAAPVQVSCTRQSGSLFGVGTTSVQCTASDSAGRSASCTFNVNVTVATSAPRLTRTRFMAFGDSLTAGEVAATAGFRSGQSIRLVLDPVSAYPTRLAALLRMRYTAQANMIEVVNAGQSGEWAQDGTQRFESMLSAVRPEVVILLDGANDVGALGDRGINAAAAALDRMARVARGRDVRVVMATLPPPRPGGIRTLPDAQVRELNSRIRAIAGGEGAVLVDLYGGLLSDVNRYIGVDGLHPTVAGYERIAELMLQAIRATFEVRGSTS